MTNSPTQVAISYFGKVPGRGDFVKTAGNLALLDKLDDWLAQTMMQFSENPRWKIVYDNLHALDFALLGTQKSGLVAGRIVPSSDQAQRRYPFLTLVSAETNDPALSISFSPVIFSSLWHYLAAQSQAVVAAVDPAKPLQNLASRPVSVSLGGRVFKPAFEDFLTENTMDSLSRMLYTGDFTGSVRQLMLALGLLLQPVMAGGNGIQADKSLVLPLPGSGNYSYYAATFWMHLITPFLTRRDFELALFLTTLAGKPVLVLGFNGTSMQTLLALFDAQTGQDHHIGFDSMDWVENEINADYGLTKLSSYLMQPGLSLASALKSFHAAFIGI